MKKLLLTFTLILLNISILVCQSSIISKYIFNSFTVAESLPHNFIDDLYKDSHGFLWVSTGGGGLVRYDGYEFLTLSVNSLPISLKSNYIRKVSEDNFDRLWVVSNMGIDVINLRTMQKAVLDYSKIDRFSNLNAQIVKKDKNGNIWILSVEKIYKINFDKKGSITKVVSSQTVKGAAPNVFTTISEIDNNIFVGNRGSIYQVLSTQNGSLSFKPFNESLNFGDNTFISTIIKKDNTLWIGTDNGLYKYLFNSKMLEHYTHSENDKSTISQDMVTDLALFDNGTLVIGTLRGLNLYDAEKNNFTRISAKTGSKTSLSNDFINCLLPDNGVLWIGTESGGINKMTLPKLSTQNYVNDADNPGTISPNPVNAIFEDPEGNLWLGTVEGGLNRKIPGSNSFIHYTTANSNLSHNSVSALEMDGNNNLWTGTWGGGINILNLNQLSHPNFTQINFPTQFIGVLKYDSVNNGMWIGTNRNIFFYDIQSKKTANPLPASLYQRLWGTLGCLIDHKNNLYIGTSEGLAIINLNSYHRNSSKFSAINFTGNGEKVSPLFMRNITCIMQSDDNSIWIGSNGYGICRMTYSSKGYKLHFFDKENGLSHNTVFGIQEDENGLIWISTGHGLSCYNPITDYFSNYTTNDGLISNQFYWNASYKSPTNKNIYFGSNDGLTELTGVQQNNTKSTGKIVFTKLQILNKTVWFGDNKYLKSDISYADRITLHERDKSFSLEFAALGYDNPSTVAYSYRLLGFDDKWITTNADRRFITYTNLRPGKYIFQVRSMSRGNDWSEQITQLKIIVRPYFYKTIWFIAILMALILWGIYRFYKWRIYSLKVQHEQLQQKVDRRTKELQIQKKTLETQADELIKQNEILAAQNRKIDFQRRQLIEMSAKVQEAMTDRISFFTNITHEFRTPITLIIGPIERALKLSTNPGVIEQLQFVSRNSKHLLSLVNQLMDFRKVESAKMNIQLKNGDIVSFLEDILVPFDSYAAERKIKIRRIYRLVSPDIMFDDEAIRKLVTNLLSNAIKFTPDNGSITLYVSSLKDKDSGREKLYICLKDNGFGIDKDDINQIFDRFYQSKKYEKLSVSGQSGTGIGLYLCSKIVELLEGTISVKNNRGKGAAFRVLLPFERNIASKEKFDADRETGIDDDHEVNDSDIYLSPRKPTILVVEDNHDMRKYISSILSDYYKIEEAENGEEALNMLRHRTIDFVVSDLMMPVMDGLELSRIVKSDFTISHIPFLMLTAKSNVEMQISSYKVGVDDFLAKPFDEELLLARISNLLEARRTYQRKFSLNMDLKELNINEESKDEKFLRKAIEIVKENYKNPDYEVTDFISDMGISKSLLNKKMHTLTGQPAVQFIRNYRLTIAHSLILNQKGSLNISEIAFEVGFNDPKYFTRCFTKHYGTAPSSLHKGE
ncbi:MAG: hybrid sensor histidine kinase/response regulator transcription factor [Paludibacteraceae bacterium]